MESATTAFIGPDRDYCDSLVSYSRRETIAVNIGSIALGADHPIRIQSMTTVDTMDTQGSVEQIRRMVDSGCDYVRITAPSIKEAENLQQIKRALKNDGIEVPLIADIHFTPNAAELAARIVEKVRINPGNYADKKRFELIEYSEDSYQQELERIRKRFTPLVEICKEYGTAMRIGTNHGSLSDRIMSRYGDTPLGMVESALEFLRICESLNYYQIVLSMKASNPQVMVQAYRLLVNRMQFEGLKPYPLHLGVTEAGEGEDGRIKSAVGIGSLLEDGLGDTVRVSLTEEPEFEAPIAKMLVDRYQDRANHDRITEVNNLPIDPFSYRRRTSHAVDNFGDHNVPRVIADFTGIGEIAVNDLKSIGHFYLPEPDKWSMNDSGADYLYTGRQPVSFMLPNGLREIVDYPVWNQLQDHYRYPLLTLEELKEDTAHPILNFVKLSADQLDAVAVLRSHPNAVVWLETDNLHGRAALRRFAFELMTESVTNPVVISRKYSPGNLEILQLKSATDIGSLLIDGIGDGVFLNAGGPESLSKELKLSQIKDYNQTCFTILQAARTRMTKTEYISCPSCGRTLFDLQETTARIRKRTDHLKGVKIGIMGCIVNGPGEMADADYGYVGSGKGKITLYKGQEVIKRGVPSANAVDELIEIIKEDGQWVEPTGKEM
ncbi:MAG: 4-hydroxy-3-methylbut-2-en-1-yl diphosphate synthase (flavodoxin) [Cyclobacteriaceae bacterium]|nr:MAG: 4-hydroxy-3-methylbut-2-en-1-yl diphosphate synthase (flavodoxin) [Cyclobacteriaceae bacterium]